MSLETLRRLLGAMSETAQPPACSFSRAPASRPP